MLHDIWYSESMNNYMQQLHERTIRDVFALENRGHYQQARRKLMEFLETFESVQKSLSQRPGLPTLDQAMTEINLERSLDRYSQEFGDQKLIRKINTWLLSNMKGVYEVNPKHKSIVT